MTCKRPTPAWWVLGSCTGPIIMTRPSFIWSRMFLTKTPATGPSAWLLLTSSCSRTPGTCPRSPTWTSKYTLAVMACWQPPITRPHPPGPTATWWLTSTSQHPRNFACATPCFLMRTFWRHSAMDPPLRPEKRGVIAEEGPPPSPAMGPRSARPRTWATRLWSPGRRRPRQPAGRPGKRRQWGEDGFYRTSVKTSTQSSTWAGGLAPRAPRNQRWTARRRHSKGPLQVGTVSGPLPTASAASHGPDQGADVAWRSWSYCPARTDVRHGVGWLWGRGRGRKCISPVQCQMALDLHHSAGRAPTGTGLAGLGKPGHGHSAQDCASQGLGIAGGGWQAVAISAGGLIPWGWLSMA